MMMSSSISISNSNSMGLLFLPSSKSRLMMMASISTSTSTSTQPPHHNSLSHHHHHQQDFVRPLVNFPEKISSDRFSPFTDMDQKVHEEYAKEIQPLKEEARKMLMEECKAVDKLYLIDNIERLGLSYHFEDEIEEQLQLLFNQNNIIGFDLSTVALQFRLFRQHGYAISSDVFEEFTYGNGKFKKSLKSDAKGLLNLYDAAYVRTRKDVILDEALSFTRHNLQSSDSSRGAYIDTLVKHALEQSLHRGVPRLEARHFIGAYEQYEMQNASLLRFAKLDFNLLQLLYKQELSASLRWWKEIDAATNVPYARNRLVESYFWALVMFFEPKYSKARLMVTKYLSVGTFIDDTYDAYGSRDELEIFTSAIQRWDIGEADRLPGYMKNAYTAFLKMNEEFEQYASQQGRPCAFHYLKEAWKEYSRSSNMQSIWFFESKELPSFDEYMVHGLVTGAGRVNACVCTLLMESGREEDVFQWFFQNPPILTAGNTIYRLVNDVAGYNVEKETGIPNSIDCYMKEYNVSSEEAKRRLTEMVENAWKDFNEEYRRKEQTMPPITKEVWELLLNQTRIMDVAYKNGIDGWTKSQDSLKHFLNSLLVDPIPI